MMHDQIMRNVELSLYRKARVWTSSLPDAVYISSKSINVAFSANLSSTSAPDKIAAVELYVPQGLKCSYGLLGGSF